MTDFIQQSFLGASIRDFDAHLGWGSSPSQLTVNVCEDDSLNERFDPPYPGVLVYFDYMGWQFGGLIQSYKKIRGEEGNALYSVILEDPRELLNGVELIINDYISTTYSVPNLYNIYGYLESTVGFGAADVNSAGIPWDKIRDTFLILQNTTPLRIYDQSFIVDFSNLPVLPSYHRISGTNISLMDFISDICHATGRDFFFRLIYRDNKNVLVLYTIDRTSNSDPNAIVNFIETLDGFNRSEIGLEFRNETNNKFLVGGNVHKLYKQILSSETNIKDSSPYFSKEPIDDITDNNTSYPWYVSEVIYPFFGDKENGQGIKFAYTPAFFFSSDPDAFSGNEYWYFVRHQAYNDILDHTNQDISESWPLDIIDHTTIGFHHPAIKSAIKRKIWAWFDTDDVYYTDYRELRAALTSQEAWANFLFMQKDQNTSTITFQGQILRTFNIHRGKFGKDGFDMISMFNPGFLTEIDDKLADTQVFIDWVDRDLDMSTIMSNKVTLDKDANNNPKLQDAIDHEETIRKVYETIRQFAEEYFGKQFMVSVPFVSGKINRDETSQVSDWRGDVFTLPGNKIVTSWEPALDGGYIDNVDYQVTEGTNGSEYSAPTRGEFAKAIEDKLLPLDVKNLSNDDGRILAYARFLKTGQGGVEYDFSQISESDKVEFNGYLYIKCELHPNLVFVDNSNLFSPRAVIKLPGIVSIAKFKYTWQAEMLKGILIGKAKDSGKFNEQQIDNLKAKLDDKFGFAGVGQDFMNEDYFPMPVMPSMVVIPLKSNTNTYGPWYTIGANGKTEFESDPELVPWNYGSYNDMNLAAQARVQDGRSSQQYGSTGSVTFAGVPIVPMGDLLISGGPYLTDLQVSIGEQGATTTYIFNTWTKQFGVTAKETLDEIRRSKTLMNKQHKAMFQASKKSFSKNNQFGAKSSKGGSPKRFKSFSTHPVLVSDKTGSKNTIVMSPGYHMVDQTLVPSGKNVAALDTLFVPFSTNYNERSQPHFELPSGSISTINATGLNPFTGPHNFTLMTRASHESEEELNIIDSGINDIDGYRAFALRSPLVLAGWGVDINGKPVPNKTPSSPGNEYAPGYRQDPTLWKAGPLHCGWDDTNKMWVATGGNNIKLGFLRDHLPFNGSGLCDIYNYQNASGKHIVNNSVYVFDWLLSSGHVISRNTKCILLQTNDRYYVINASVYNEGYSTNSINY
jgi:hypothetical protein